MNINIALLTFMEYIHYASISMINITPKVFLSFYISHYGIGLPVVSLSLKLKIW